MKKTSTFARSLFVLTLCGCGEPPEPTKAAPVGKAAERKAERDVADPKSTAVAPGTAAPAGGDTKADAAKLAPNPDQDTGPDPDANDAKADAGPGKIGVAACDEYIAKYSTCIADKVPADIRDLMKDAIAQSEKVWKAEAAGPEKDRLSATCRSALDAAKHATAKYGCVW